MVDLKVVTLNMTPSSGSGPFADRHEEIARLCKSLGIPELGFNTMPQDTTVGVPGSVYLVSEVLLALLRDAVARKIEGLR